MDDYCYECTGYGDDYYYDEETHDLVCACYECPLKDLDEVIAQYNQEDDGAIMDLLTSVRDMVSNKPIAYDIDTVVEQLENVSFVDVDEEYADDGQRMLFLQDAIEIVKKGGVE